MSHRECLMHWWISGTDLEKKLTFILSFLAGIASFRGSATCSKCSSVPAKLCKCLNLNRWSESWLRITATRLCTDNLACGPFHCPNNVFFFWSLLSEIWHSAQRTLICRFMWQDTCTLRTQVDDSTFTVPVMSDLCLGHELMKLSLLDAMGSLKRLGFIEINPFWTWPY